MAATTVKFQQTRHQRRRNWLRTRRAKKYLAWLGARATALTGTGATAAFTVETAAIAATGVLTLTGVAVDADDMTIGTKVYTFQDTLTDVDGNIHVQADAPGDITAIVAAILGNNRTVEATGVLTLTGLPLDTETFVVGGTTYTMQTSLVDVADNILIGSDAADTILNIVAAISAGAGAGTLYGTGTVANPDATAVDGAGDTIDFTAVTLGDAGNSIVFTEAMTNVTISGAGTLTGGITRYAASMTAHPDVSAADGAGDTVDLTALVGGLAGNLIATTQNLTNGSFGAVTLEGGEEGDALNMVAHGLVTGEGPMVLTTTTTLPAGLELLTQYWVEVLDVDNLRLHTTLESAQGKHPASVPDITDTGTGTHSIARAAEIDQDIHEWNRVAKSDTIQEITDIDSL